jgi:DeoR/GlpR family transcriptional regulator of sugar metabolism
MGGAPNPTTLRRDLIRTELARSGGVRIRDLVHRFGVSRTTVRRDLYVLIDAGEAVNAHGGALLPADRTPASPATERQSIAASAASTVAQHEAVGLFGGPLIRALARQLSDRADVHVVTNSLPIAQILDTERGRGPRVTLLSGELRPSGAVTGSLAAKTLCGLQLDTSYFDCAGFDDRTGATIDDLDEADLRRTSIQSSRRSILLVERARSGVGGLGSFGTPGDFHLVIEH